MFQVLLLFTCVLPVVCPPDTGQRMSSQVKSLQRTIDSLRNDLSKEQTRVNILQRAVARLSTMQAKLNDLERKIDSTKKGLPATSSSVVRLVGGSVANEGRVEIYHNGRWGTVCDDAFSAIDASVVCHMLGYQRSGAKSYSRAHFGSGSGFIWLDQVGCSGTEASIVDCKHNDWGDHDCVRTEDVGVSCVPPILLADCWGHKMRNSSATTGWYKIQSPVGKSRPLSVYCDMDTAGGGWTVFQRRVDGSTDFDRSYAVYRRGFGNRVEFWLGNDAVHALTLNHPQQLRVDLCDWNGKRAHATYQSFSVGPAQDAFRLNAEGYRGNAGNALDRGDQYTSNQQRFSAPGADNDRADTGDCAKQFSGGWWFNNCHSAYLNGIYSTGYIPKKNQGIKWLLWRPTIILRHSLKACEMKFRPSSANPSSTQPYTCPK